MPARVKKKTFRNWVLTLGVVLLAGVASAQVPAPRAAPSSGGSAAAGTLEAAKQHMSSMDQVRSRVRRQLETARKQRDVVKTLCLNDKLNQIDVLLRSANERVRALQAAVASGDSELSNHEFTILNVLYSRSQQISAEADQCIGKEVGFVGESSVTVEIDVELPNEDPSEFPPALTISQPPACASCFK
jgi:uncharacterized protein YqeY